MYVGATLISGLMVAIAVLGYLASVILFVVGLIRLILKRGWKILIISIVLFGIITIFLFVSQIIFATVLGPTINKTLQEQSVPRVFDLNPPSSQSIQIKLRTPAP
jgi:hypothetical protein